MSGKILLSSLLFFICLSFADCATVIHGSRQRMIFTCDPRVASVFVDGEYLGSTPMEAWLKRGRDHTVVLQLAGYKPYRFLLRRGLDGWFLGNIFLGFVVGMAIDAGTGSMFRLHPGTVYPELKLLSEGEGGRRGDGLAVLVTLHPDPSWEKIEGLPALCKLDKH